MDTSTSSPSRCSCHIICFMKITTTFYFLPLQFNLLCINYVVDGSILVTVATHFSNLVSSHLSLSACILSHKNKSKNCHPICNSHFRRWKRGKKIFPMDMESLFCSENKGKWRLFTSMFHFIGMGLTKIQLSQNTKFRCPLYSLLLRVFSTFCH